MRTCYLGIMPRLLLYAGMALLGCSAGNDLHPPDLAARAVFVPKEQAVHYLEYYLYAAGRLKEAGLGDEKQLRLVMGRDTTVITIPAIDHAADRDVLGFLKDNDSTYVTVAGSAYVFFTRNDTLEVERTRCLDSLLKDISIP